MQTRKHPRTLEKAFGPYERGPVHEPTTPIDWQDKLVLWASAITAVALGILTWV